MRFVRLTKFTIKRKVAFHFILGYKEEVIKVTPLYDNNGSGRRVRFRVITVIGDGEGVYGYAEKVHKQETVAVCKATGKAYRTKRVLIRGNWDLCTVETVPFTVRGRCGEVMVQLKPAPSTAGINGPAVCRKILRVAGIKSCLMVVRGNKRKIINLARATNAALSKLDTRLFF